MELATNRLFKQIKTTSQIEVKGELLKQLQSILLEMLKDFASICEKYHLYYSLCGGTALGAVRHQGFIPWDDDVDVFMYRMDLKEFYEAFDKELSSKYDLHSMERTPELGVPIIRMLKKGTVYVVDDTLDCPERGIFIDICVLENAPDNFLLRKIHGLGSMYFGLCVSCSRFYRKRDIYRKQFASANKEIRHIIEKKIMIGRLLSWRSLKKWTLKYSWWNSLCKNSASRFVVCPTGTKHYFGEIFPRDIYMKTKLMQFEDAKFCVIDNYDWALTRLYGDYMRIPSEDERERHFVMEIQI